MEAMNPEVLMQMMIRNFPELINLETLDAATGGTGGISKLGHDNAQMPRASGDAFSNLLQVLAGRGGLGGPSSAPAGGQPNYSLPAD